MDALCSLVCTAQYRFRADIVRSESPVGGTCMLVSRQSRLLRADLGARNGQLKQTCCKGEKKTKSWVDAAAYLERNRRKCAISEGDIQYCDSVDELVRR